MTVNLKQVHAITPVPRSNEPTVKSDKVVAITPVALGVQQTVKTASKSGMLSQNAHDAWSTLINSVPAEQSTSPVIFPPECALIPADPQVRKWFADILAEMNEADVNYNAVLGAANTIITLDHLNTFGALSNQRSKEHMERMMAMLQDENLVRLRNTYVNLAELIAEYRTITAPKKPQFPVSQTISQSPAPTGWFKRLFGGANEQVTAPPVDDRSAGVTELVNNIKAACATLTDTNPKVGGVVQELWGMMGVGQKTSKHLLIDIVAMRIRERQASTIMSNQSNPMEAQKWRVTVEQCSRRVKHLLLAENLTKSDWVALNTSLQEIQTLSGQVDDLVIVVHSQILQEQNLTAIQSSRQQVTDAMKSLSANLNATKPNSPPSGLSGVNVNE